MPKATRATKTNPATRDQRFDPAFFDRPSFAATLQRYASDRRLPLHQAREHFIAAAQYVTVSAHTLISVSPSQELDAPLHAFILATREYREFCMTYFGKFVDHEPYAPGASRPDQYANALSIARELFDATELNPEFWHEPHPVGSGGDGDCG